MTTVETRQTRSQRIAALERANQVRVKRAELKRAIWNGDASMCETIVAPPDWAEEMRLWDLLTARKRMGKHRVNRVLWDCRIRSRATLRELTGRQRAALVDHELVW